MSEMLSTLSLVAYIVVGIFLIVAIFLWFYFDVYKIMGDLSGRTAKKSNEINLFQGKNHTKSQNSNKTRTVEE